jgi:hypothetical protein
LDRHDSDNLDTPGLAATEVVAETCAVSRCCVETIGHHVRHNPMMVCAECKQIIKCFSEESPYRNFLTFCRSRRRPVTVGKVAGYHTVVFRSYNAPGDASRRHI